MNSIPLAPPEIERAIATATKLAKQQSVGEAYAKAHGSLPNVVQAMVDMATKCPTPEMRYKAAVWVRDFVASDDAFSGDTEALVSLSMLPIDRQHSAALQLFARGQINRKDLATIKDLIGAAGATARIEALKAENESLFQELEEADGQTINGRTN